MTAGALLSTLAISGGSASSGSWSTTRETRSRMSLAASSMSRFEAELDADVGTLVAAGRGQFLDALETGDRVFDNLRDLGLDHLGRRAAVSCLDGNDRRIDVRVLAHRQAAERGEAQDDEQQRK